MMVKADHLAQERRIVEIQLQKTVERRRHPSGCLDNTFHVCRGEYRWLRCKKLSAGCRIAG